MSVQDVRRYAAVLEGIEKILRIITYCRTMESIYFRKNIRINEEAKKAVVDLYASTFFFLVKARKFFAESPMSKQVILLART